MDDDQLDESMVAIITRMEDALRTDPYPTLAPLVTYAGGTLNTPQESTTDTTLQESFTAQELSAEALKLLMAESPAAFYQQLERCKGTQAHDNIASWEHKVGELLRTSDDIDEAIAALRDRLSTLMELNGKVKAQSEALSAGATSLLAHKEKLERSLQSTEHKLNFFFEVDAASNTIHIPQLSPFHENFIRAVQKLDDGERFLQSHKHYSAAPTYLNRVYLAKQKALTILRDVITARITSATAHVTASPNYKEASVFDGRGTDEGAASLDVSVESAMVGNVGICTVLNVEFRAKLNDVLPLIGILQDRCKVTATASGGSGGGSRDIRVILEGVVNHYVASRVRILRPLLSEFVKYMQRNLGSFLDPPQLKHLASGGVSYLLALSIEESVLLNAVWNPSNNAGVGTLTKMYLTSIVDNVAQEVYDAYRSEVLREDDIKALCFLVDCLSSSLLDGKVKSAGEVGKFVAPVIQRMIEDTQERLYFRSHMYIKDVLSPFTYTSKDVSQFCHVEGQKGAPFPPLENCLFLLSMLYNAIGKDVFCGIAEEAMRNTVTSTQRVATIIRANESIPERGLHAVLFSLKLYLRLREQISPFDVSFSVMERGLDVTTLVRTRNVAIHVTSRDAKKLLEDEIRLVCEDFIKIVAGDLVAIIRKYLDELARTTTPQPSVIQEVTEKLLPDVVARAGNARDVLLKQYIGNSMTSAVLWKPVIGQVTDEYKRLFSLLVDTFGATDTANVPTPIQFGVQIT